MMGEYQMQKGKIVFPNGVSSSGKTTLARELQERLTEPFYWLAVDTFVVDMMPKKFLSIDGFNPDGGEPVIFKTVSLAQNTIKFFSDMGINTIVEHLLFPSIEVQPYKNQMTECVELLHDYPVLFVHVTCSLEELRRREKERGDRDIGRAEIQLPYLKPNDPYDINVDTHANSTGECAEKIIELLACPEKFTTFKTHWEQRSR
jgi:chloramphenicol 3-O phosphotransferase